MSISVKTAFTAKDAKVRKVKHPQPLNSFGSLASFAVQQFFIG